MNHNPSVAQILKSVPQSLTADTVIGIVKTN